MKRKKPKEELEDNVEKELKLIMAKMKNERLALNKILIQLKANESATNKEKEELENKKITNT